MAGEEDNNHFDFSQRQELSLEYGGFWLRFLAFHVDVIVLFVIRHPVALLFYLLSDDFSAWGGLRRGANNIGLGILYSLINTVVWFLYFTVLTAKQQKTLGKRLFGLKVLGEDLMPINMNKAFIREIFRFFSVIPCCLGYIWAAFDSRKQTWHDKVAKTLVVKERKGERSDITDIEQGL